MIVRTLERVTRSAGAPRSAQRFHDRRQNGRNEFARRARLQSRDGRHSSGGDAVPHAFAAVVRTLQAGALILRLRAACRRPGRRRQFGDAGGRDRSGEHHDRNGRDGRQPALHVTILNDALLEVNVSRRSGPLRHRSSTSIGATTQPALRHSADGVVPDVNDVRRDVGRGSAVELIAQRIGGALLAPSHDEKFRNSSGTDAYPSDYDPSSIRLLDARVACRRQPRRL
jgi:hypothetical protein